MTYKLFTLKINNDYNESVTYANRNVSIPFSVPKIELHENRVRSSCNWGLKLGFFCWQIQCCAVDQIDKPVFFRHNPKKVMKTIKSRSATVFNRRDEFRRLIGSEVQCRIQGWGDNGTEQRISAEDGQQINEKKRSLAVKGNRNYTPPAVICTCSINNYGQYIACALLHVKNTEKWADNMWCDYGL